jgi:ribonuclease D
MNIIRAWLKRLFAKTEPPRHTGRHPTWPTQEQILKLPPFEALDLNAIVQISSPEAARRACEELMHESVVGFDTESKPTFVKGQVSTGPHVVQFSTERRAYIFLLHHSEIRAAVRTLIAAPSLKKVGFGLNEDLRRIKAKLHITPESVLDLETMFSARGHGRGVGVKVGVAIVLKRRFSKSKRASTSNWMTRRLSVAQLLYAANDAYAPLRVFHALTP